MISATTHIARLARAGFVFAREGVLGLVDPAPLPAPARLALKLARLVERPNGAGSSVKLSAALTRLGPTYVKLGQMLSTRPDLLPDAYIRALSRLQDKVKPFAFEEVEAIVGSELDVRLSKAFSYFETAPTAAASLGQVHMAALRDGREVVVKVQRPDVAKKVADDFFRAGQTPPM